MTWTITCPECMEKTDKWIFLHTSEGVKSICIKCFVKLLKAYENID